MLRNLTGAAIGGILVAVGASEAGARKKKRGGGKRKRRRSQCTSCGDGCPGDPESTPTKTYAFAPSGDPDYCVVAVHLAGFAGCTQFTAEYWAKAVGNLGTVTLGPTDVSGSSQTTLGSYGKGGEVDIRINGAASSWQPVSC